MIAPTVNARPKLLTSFGALMSENQGVRLRSEAAKEEAGSCLGVMKGNAMFEVRVVKDQHRQETILNQDELKA